ncbi:hypothetical protein [Novosphingobium sp. PhB165]|uniref:hypothetical protein n=1 Tax=Novosphingobium sp. PhB165 TaxID=2485105 RepID=UPI0014051F6A|nr:hypothetical protein [Novosphingobium sp. PhB165]
MWNIGSFDTVSEVFEGKRFMDWNPVVYVLDELRDGPRSLFEIDATISRFERGSFVQSLFYLAERELIELSAVRHPFEPIPKTEWQRRLREALEGSRPDPIAMTGTSIDLSQKGIHVLQLLGIGYS